jgi:hypothetical protein
MQVSMMRLAVPANVHVLDLEVTALLAATTGYMPAAGSAIARGLCDRFNSRQEMLNAHARGTILEC